MKTKKLYNFCGIILFKYDSKINRWLIKKIFIPKEKCSSTTLKKIQSYILNNQARICRLSNNYFNYDTETFINEKNFVECMIKYSQPIDIINNYTIRINKLIKKRG